MSQELIANGSGVLFLCIEDNSGNNIILSTHKNSPSGLSSAARALLPDIDGSSDDYKKKSRKLFMYTSSLTAAEQEAGTLPAGSVDITPYLRPATKQSNFPVNVVNIAGGTTKIYEFSKTGPITSIELNPSLNATIDRIDPDNFLEGDILVLYPSSALKTIQVTSTNNIKLSTESFFLKETTANSIDRNIMLIRGDFGSFDWMELSRNQVISADDILGADVTVPSGKTYYYTKDSAGNTGFTPINESSVSFIRPYANLNNDGTKDITIGSIPANSLVTVRDIIINAITAGTGTAVISLSIGGNDLITSQAITSSPIASAGNTYYSASSAFVWSFNNATDIILSIESGTVTRSEFSLIIPYIQL